MKGTMAQRWLVPSAIWPLPQKHPESSYSSLFPIQLKDHKHFTPHSPCPPFLNITGSDRTRGTWILFPRSFENIYDAIKELKAELEGDTLNEHICLNDSCSELRRMWSAISSSWRSRCGTRNNLAWRYHTIHRAGSFVAGWSGQGPRQS